jgi:hypothetical protein
MANSLHFIPYAKQAALLARAKAYLRPGGRMVIVEYDTNRGNMWVPHPFQYERWEKMAEQAGFIETRQLAYRAGGFLNGMYSAVSITAKE